MEFKNYIRYGDKKLNRGDLCLYHGARCLYLGSYKEDGYGWTHMLRIENKLDFRSTLSVIEQCIIQVNDKTQIVCKESEKDPIERQMILC